MTDFRLTRAATDPRPPSRWDIREPCANCPYRKDAPRKLWHRSEFERLLATERSEFGAFYGCHKNDGNPCAGWLLDQRERGYPSIMLRMTLCASTEAVTCAEALTDGGHALFPSIEAMCRANGVRR